MNREFLKSNAKEQLRGKWKLAIATLLIFTVLESINSSLNLLERPGLVQVNSIVAFAITIFIYLFEGVFRLGVCKFTLNLATDKEKASFNDAFSGFRIYFKTLFLNLIISVCIIIGLLILVVPGIIFILMFSQAFYILCEDNNKGILECLQESSKMMKGYKGDYLILMISFIGWDLLALITLNIGYIALNPYKCTTYANYYLELKK